MLNIERQCVKNPKTNHELFKNAAYIKGNKVSTSGAAFLFWQLLSGTLGNNNKKNIFFFILIHRYIYRNFFG